MSLWRIRGGSGGGSGRSFALPRGERFYRLAYLTYGAKAPAFWEATVYLGDTGWKVMDLSVEIDKIFEKAEGLPLAPYLSCT